MHIPLMRLFRFLRSTFPQDPSQILLLCGLVCLTISPHLRWWPADGSTGLGTEQFALWRIVFNIAIWPMIFAAAAGYFAAFWPGRRPALRVLLIVVFPAAFAILAIGIRFLRVQFSSMSVLNASRGFLWNSEWTISHLWKMGSGFHYGLLGVMFVSFFVLRMASGASALPLRILSADCSDAPEAEQWKGCKRVIWVFQGASILVLLPISVTTLLIYLLVSPSNALQRLGLWNTYFSPPLLGIVMLLLAGWLMGKANRKLVFALLRVGSWKNLPLGAAIPIAITVVLTFGHYLFDRANWAMRWREKFSAPELGDYFNLPEISLLTLIFAAFAEEVIFRGVLQKHFIHRYGTWRGIFLVSVVWAAFHFFGDRYSRETDVGVVVDLGSRIVSCLVLGFVLSWLTLRSNSLWPATLAHTVANICSSTQFDPLFPGRQWVRFGLWGILAYCLFRYWPPRREEPAGLRLAEPKIEPA